MPNINGINKKNNPKESAIVESSPNGFEKKYDKNIKGKIELKIKRNIIKHNPFCLKVILLGSFKIIFLLQHLQQQDSSSNMIESKDIYY